MREKLWAKVQRGLKPARSLGSPFYLVFLAGVLSDIGGFATQTALALHIYKLSNGNAAYQGLMALATLVPIVLAASIGGVWAERYPRVRVMIGNDLIRAPLVLLMITTQSVWLLLLLQALLCFSSGLFSPSRQSIIPDIMSPDRLQLGNALFGGVASVMHVLSPILGAVLYAKAGSLTYVVMLESISYLLSALLLSRLNEPPRQMAMERSRGLLRDIAEGFRYVKREPDLWQIFLWMLSAGLALGLMVPLLRPFAGEALHGDDRTFTHLVAWFGAGGLLGPPLGYLFGRWLGLGRTLLFLFLLDAVVFTLWSRSTTVESACGLIFAWGLVSFSLIPCHTSYIHTYAKREFMGRTFALLDQSNFVPQIIAAALIVLLGDRLPVVRILTGIGLLYVLFMLISLPSQGSKLLRSRVPIKERASVAEEAAQSGDHDQPV